MSSPVWLGELLDWLSENGVDVDRMPLKIGNMSRGYELFATRDLTERERLVNLPPSVLLNVRTVVANSACPEEVVDRLSAFQLLALVLSVNRPQPYRHSCCPSTCTLRNLQQKSRNNNLQLEDIKEENEGQDDVDAPNLSESCLMSSFAPYFASLPSKFDTIPLWVIKSNTLNTPQKQAFKLAYQEFANHCFTPSLITKTNSVLARYERDLGVVKNVLSILPKEDSSRIMFCEEDFLWGWLIVNTRSMWCDLSAANHEDNITLAPFLDMANHDPRGKATIKVTADRGIAYYSSPVENLSFSVFNKKKFTQKLGEPVPFKYGGHDDECLLSEYGFTLGWETNHFNSVDVTKEVRKLFNYSQLKTLTMYGYGDNSDYAIVRNENNGYEGSYNLMVSLRLLHLKSLEKADLAPWMRHIEGVKDIVSPENEKLVQQTLVTIARGIVYECRSTLQKIKVFTTEGYFDQRFVILNTKEQRRQERMQEQQQQRSSAISSASSSMPVASSSKQAYNGDDGLNDPDDDCDDQEDGDSDSDSDDDEHLHNVSVAWQKTHFRTILSWTMRLWKERLQAAEYIFLKNQDKTSSTATTAK